MFYCFIHHEKKYKLQKEVKLRKRSLLQKMCIDDVKLCKKEQAGSIDSSSSGCNSSSKCHVRECNSFQFENIINATVFTETELQEMIDEGMIDVNDENNGVGAKNVVNFNYPHMSREIRCIYSLLSNIHVG